MFWRDQGGARRAGGLGGRPRGPDSGESMQGVSEGMNGPARILLLSEIPADPMTEAVGATLAAAGHDVQVRESPSDADPADFDFVLTRPSRGASHLPTDDVTVGRLRIDSTRRLVYVDDVPVRMSAREFALLHELASHPDVVLSRAALLQSVWGSQWRTPGSVTEYIRRLRLMLAPHGIGECIVTRKGFGYSFDPEAVS